MKPRRRLYAAHAKDQPSVAVLVHGTFAGAPENRGSKWWQSGSPVAKELATRVPPSVDVAPETMVFHWSGENSERARSKAASELLEQLQALEAADKPYHLIGHSHGGSVIWNTLKLATIHRYPLERLRTWTTVGTPFLQHRSRDAWNPLNLIALVVGLILLRPAYRTFMQISILLWNAALGSREKFIISANGNEKIHSIFEYPILALLRWTGIQVTATDGGVQIGNYDPASSLSMAGYLFTTGEGLFLLTMALAAAYMFLIVSLMCIRPVIESYRIRAEYHLEDDAFAAYQSRWLGIWSKDDEAINGLRATLDLTMSFLGKMQPRERVFLSDNLNLLARPVFWLFAPIYNFLVHPLVDRAIRGLVTRSAQGNDRPTANIVDVSPCPFGPFRDLAPPIPEMLREKILARADRAACDVAPKLRKLLGSPSFTHGLEAFSKDLAGGELVHTSYFDHSEILDLIACNVAWGTNDNSMRMAMHRMPAGLTSWFAQTKSQLQPAGVLPMDRSVDEPGAKRVAA